MAATPRSSRRTRSLVVLVVLLVTALQGARVLRAELAITGGEITLPLDDSFIYLQYSRAIAEGHPFVYTPGNEPTTGATSLGYPLLLLPPHLLRLGPELCIAWTLALGVAAFAHAIAAGIPDRQGRDGSPGTLRAVSLLALPMTRRIRTLHSAPLRRVDTPRTARYRPRRGDEQR